MSTYFSIFAGTVMMYGGFQLYLYGSRPGDTGVRSDLRSAQSCTTASDGLLTASCAYRHVGASHGARWRLRHDTARDSCGKKKFHAFSLA